MFEYEQKHEETSERSLFVIKKAPLIRSWEANRK
jgi:hypothetical protein